MSTITGIVKPFSLLAQEINIAELIDDLSTKYNIDTKCIEDIYPCTPMQEGFLALSAQHKGSYVHNIMVELAGGIRLDDLCRAWEDVVKLSPILRTRFVQHKTLGLLQMVLREGVDWIRKEGKPEDMGVKEMIVEFGQPLTRYTIINDMTKKCHWFIWTIHHAVNDGESRRLISTILSDFYHGRPVPQQHGFNVFVKHTREQDWAQGREYWSDSLQGAEPVVFPSRLGDSKVFNRRATTECEHSVAWNRNWKAGRSTLVSAMWALTLHHFYRFTDIVFGTVVSGRRSPNPEVGHIVGPTLATVPIRFQIRKEESVAQYLTRAHGQAVCRVPYEQMGLQNIAQVSEDACQACGFHNLLVVQAWGNSWYSDENIEVCHSSPEDLAPIAYPFVVQIESVSTPILTLDISNLLRPIIWKWNAAVPTPVKECADQLIIARALKQPKAIAVSAWDGTLTYEDLDRWSTELAIYLTKLGVQRGTVVPLYFRKSVQMPVATLGVLRAGGTVLQLSHMVPTGRIETIFKQSIRSLL
ncbi:condensation domain-containing protein [Aspergillus germanicus]